MIAIVLAFFLSSLHFFSKKISKNIEKHHIKITSFSAGVLITLIFIDFLPKLSIGLTLDAPVFLFLTLGFIIFHISEKYIYQHIKDKKHMIKDLAILHNLGFFINHVMIGFALFLTMELKDHANYIIIIPFILHTIASSISLQHLHKKIKTKFNKILLNFSTLIGALIAFFLKLDSFWFYSLFSFSLGALLYVSMRDMLPKGKQGSLPMFLIGCLLTIVLISLT